MKKFGTIVLIIILSFIALYLIDNGSVLMGGDTASKLKKLKYNEECINLIIKNKIDDYIIKNKIESETIEVALLENKFNKDNLDLYSKVDYKDNESFIDDLNKLNKLGYTNQEIEVLTDNLNADAITIVANKNTKEDELLKYCVVSNFDINNYDRYIKYKENNPSYNYSTVVKYVNINLDHTFYSDDHEALNKQTNLILVNKFYKLDKDYTPNNLELIDSSCAAKENIYAVKVAKDAFIDLCTDVRSMNLTIKAVSAYRSYDNQKAVYDSYLKIDPVELVDTYSARPGYSEHQTGYAFDIYNVTLPYTSFGSTNEYKWLIDNAFRYGFIIRYKKDKESITGYKAEPWHIRYVGINAATYIYKHDITLEEYIDGYIKGTIKK